MIHKCVVGGCPNRSDTVIHYMLPEDLTRRSLWMKFIEDTKADEGDANSACRVCGDHFSEEHYFSLDLGYTTCRILGVDAVPTVHIVNRPSETQDETQEAEGESIRNETCEITISEAISLACVKDEPVEYELNANMLSRQELNSSLDDDVKHEESEQAVTTRVTHQYIKHKYKECLTCGQRFRRRRTLMKHLRENHTNKDKILTCSTCGEKFNTTALLLKHRNKHHKENPEGKFVCPQCGKGFEHHAFLKAHQKVHQDAETTMPFTCHLCPRRFGYKVALAAHMKHHSSKLTCICPICETSFQFRGSLVQHLTSSHAGERLLCKTCDRSFLRVDGYIKHMDRHNIMTPFYCGICQIYLSKRGYGTHMNTHEVKSAVEEEMDGTGESREGGGDAVRQEVGEVETEPPAEDERAESSMETSAVQDVEAGEEITEKELPEENHEETEMSEETLRSGSESA